jgi:hypothetical protein
MRLIYVSIKIFIGIIIYVGYYCCYVKKIVPKQNLTVKVIRYCIIIKLEDKKQKLQRITYARGINLVQTAILAMRVRF